MTHFVDVLGRKIGNLNVETLSIDRILNKKNFHGKFIAEYVHQRLDPDTFSILAITQNSIACKKLF